MNTYTNNMCKIVVQETFTQSLYRNIYTDLESNPHITLGMYSGK